ncbi:xanthine permease [Neobacillus bataviensis]|uniref:Xanthine permease n=2 Tax=Neobacillus bataviensis TaxID=220685 RepID=A0A561DE34_9BACI|nr:nucleobase:cation symporter-2 family protein [Neobacillus bataviensis]TWE01652.1 xanthine permease [Neobacillus bataviensis]
MKQGPWKTASLGIQHVLAMYAGAVIVPLIIGGALHLSGKQLAYLVSLDILTSGIATLLQVWQNRYFGIGLPIVLGCTFTAVGPIIAIGGQYGMSAIYGSILVSGIIVILISSFFGRLVRFFPPVVTGSVVTIIGITLVPVAMNNVAGGQGSPDFGSVTNLCLAFGTLLFIIVLYRFFKGFIRSISILLGLIAGTIAAALLGKVDFSAVGEASWFHMVAPLHFAVPTFELAPIITMTLVAIVSLVESTGVYFALSDITGRKLTEQDLVKGYRAEGLASIVGALFNSFPYTTYSQNVGLVQFSGVKSKNVIYTMAGILIFLGFVPKIAALTTVVPTSVLGGAMVAMFGMVIASGIKMLSKVDFSSQENLLIIACSVAVGLGVTAVPNLFDALPESVKILTNSGIVAGSLTAILLNLIFNVAKPKQQSQAINNNNQSVA